LNGILKSSAFSKLVAKRIIPLTKHQHLQFIKNQVWIKTGGQTFCRATFSYVRDECGMYLTTAYDLLLVPFRNRA
jgi:hypothetical protein